MGSVISNWVISLIYFLLVTPGIDSAATRVESSTQNTNVFEEQAWEAEHSRVSARSFFHSFGPHPTPLLFCQTKTSGAHYRLPVIPPCEFKRSDPNRQPAPVNITFWNEEPDDQIIFGFMCSAIKKGRWTTMSWYGSWQYGSKLPRYHQVSQAECEEMRKSEKTPEGKKMEMMGDGHWMYTEDPNVEYKWNGRNEEEWVEYSLQQYRIAVDSNTMKISALAPITKDCNVTQLGCPTANKGWLTWNYKEYKSCNYKMERRDTCFLLDDVLTCPARQMMLTGIRLIDVCDNKIGTSEQRVTFTPDDFPWIPDMATTAQMVASLNGRRNRVRKQIRVSSQGVVNAQFEFAQYMTLENLHRIQDQICFLNQKQMRDGIQAAKDGNPDNLVETVLGPGLRSVMQGHVMFVWSCEKINRYMFLPTPESQCSLEWPLEFMLNNGTKMLGYLGTSSEIFTTFTPTDCPQADFYFVSGRYSYVLGSRDDVDYRTFPQLPLPGDSVFQNNFKKITFTEAGEYSLADAFKRGSRRELMRDVHLATRDLDMLSNWKPENGPPNSNILRNMKEWFWYELTWVGRVTAMVIGGLVAIALLVCLIKICPWSLLKKCCNCNIRRRLSRRRLSRRSGCEPKNTANCDENPSAPPSYLEVMHVEMEPMNMER